MFRNVMFCATLVLALSVDVSAQMIAQPRVTIVNMIPKSLSGEADQDSEPFLAVNAADSRSMAASALTSDPFLGPRAPIFVTSDGGRSWMLNSMVPSESATADISVGFAADHLYAGMLSVDPSSAGYPLKLVRTNDLYSPAPMLALLTDDDVQDGPDQPYVVARGQEMRHLLLLGVNMTQRKAGQTATVFRFLDSHGAPPLKWDDVVAERRPTCNQDGPQVRSAISPDGRVAYALFYRWSQCPYDLKTRPPFMKVATDVVLLRDDLTNSEAPFSALSDSGVSVATNQSIWWTKTVLGRFGYERVGGDLAIALDPRRASGDVVYVAWSANADPAKVSPAIHLRRLNEGGGKPPEKDLLTIPNAKNPSIAMTASGRLGLIYQALETTGQIQEWVTHFRYTSDDFVSTSGSGDIVLARFTAGTPPSQGISMPYLGDYLNLVAVGEVFRGVFSSSNRPNFANFAPGAIVIYRRNADFVKHALLSTDKATRVPESIDPFFFEIDFNTGDGMTAAR